MIEDVATGRVITTEVQPVQPIDFRRIGSGWRFDWRAAIETAEVFKLVDPSAPAAILGLLAIRRHANYVEVTLLESRPRDVGRTKSFRGIPGSLFAFAGELSFDLGGEGFLEIVAKTDLIEHFHRVYGFIRIGHSQKMVLTKGASARLIREYGGRTDHGSDI